MEDSKQENQNNRHMQTEEIESITWKPKQDITPLEIAKAMECFSRLWMVHRRTFEALPDEVKRHFIVLTKPEKKRPKWSLWEFLTRKATLR